MKKLTKRNESGFTIVEVVLVLAIAGLIFLIVFLALPQLQRSRRDTQRRSDAGRALSALESYASNNNGNYPTVAQFNSFVSDYLTNDGGLWGDPETGSYTNIVIGTPDAAGEVQYQIGASAPCTGSGGARSISMTVYQESGGSYCEDNQ